MRRRSLAAVVILVLVLCPTVGLAQTNPADATGDTDSHAQSYALFLLGRHLAREGDIEGAIRAYRDAAELHPETGEILGELASLHARRNEAEDAIRVATEALDRDPANLTANRILGLVYASQVRSGQAADDVATRAIDHLEQARGTILPDLQVELTLARLYLTVDESDRAEGLLQELLDDEPGLTDAGLLLSEVYERAGRTDEAVTMLEGVIGSGRPSSRALRRLGELYGQVERWDDAVVSYEAAAARNPRSSGIQRELANALLKGGEPERARDVLEQLSTTRPDDVAVLYQLSGVELDLGNFDEAEAVARRLMDVEPNGIRGPYALAEVHSRQHDYRAMIEVLESAVNVQRQSQATRDSQATRQGRARPYQIANLLGRIGYAHEQLQDMEGAIDAYGRAVDLLPMSLAYGARLVQAYLDAGRIDDARSALDALSPHHPSDLTIARLEARILGDGGDVEGGLAVLRGALGENADNPMAHIALASFHTEHQRFDDAVDVLQAASARFPDNLSVLFQLGAVLEQSNRYNEAEGAFRRVLDRDPEHAATLNYLGYMLADRGERLEESVGLLQRAIEIDPHNGAYLDSLGWAYFKLDRLDLAEPHLRQASEQMVWNSVIQDHFGDLLFALGRYDEAIAAWDAALDGDREDVEPSDIERKIREAQQRLGR